MAEGRLGLVGYMDLLDSSAPEQEPSRLHLPPLPSDVDDGPEESKAQGASENQLRHRRQHLLPHQILVLFDLLELCVFPFFSAIHTGKIPHNKIETQVTDLVAVLLPPLAAAAGDGGGEVGSIHLMQYDCPASLKLSDRLCCPHVSISSRALAGRTDLFLAVRLLQAPPRQVRRRHEAASMVAGAKATRHAHGEGQVTVAYCEDGGLGEEGG